MAIAQKFLFEESFDRKRFEDADRAPPAADVGAEVEPAFTEAELEAARQAAYAEGHAAGMAKGRETADAEFRQSLERELAAVGERIAARLDEIAAAQSDLHARFEADVIMVASSVARRVAPRILQERAEDSIMGVIQEVLPRLLDEPRIVIRVADAVLDGVSARLHQIKTESRFSGEFIVLADAALAPSDCRVEWADGGVDIAHDRFWAQIDSALNDFVSVSAAGSPAIPVRDGAVDDEPPAGEGDANGAPDRQA